MKDDFPIGVVLRERLFFEVLVTSDDKQLSIIADRCFATPTQDQSNPLKYEFIKKGYVICYICYGISFHALLHRWSSKSQLRIETCGRILISIMQ